MVNRYKIKLTILQQEILKLLYVKSGKVFNGRRLAQFLDVSPPAISKALPFLEKENYIKVEKDKDSGRLSIMLNRDNALVMGMKRAENLKIIYESGFAMFLYETFPGSTIVLFGSYSRGDDTFNSDIDIAIIGSKEKKIDLEKFEELFEKDIVLNFYSSFKEINKNLRSNILSGIIIVGVKNI